MIMEDHLHVIEKGAVQELEAWGTPYFNVPASKNIISTNQKFSVWEIGLKPFNYRCPETKIFNFFQKNSMIKDFLKTFFYHAGMHQFIHTS